jgi:membrane-associated phospholipid phosphatase
MMKAAKLARTLSNLQTRIGRRSRVPPRLRFYDGLMIAGPALAWAAAFKARPAVMSLGCGRQPQRCAPDHVFALDRIAIGLGNARADAWSFITQDLTGALAVLVPALWAAWTWHRGRQRGRAAWLAWTTDLVLFVEMACWNGLLTESARLLVQRPRPFVYTDPARLGLDPAHYTSFLSGHTSFTAAAATHLVLTLRGRGWPRRADTALIAIATALVAATGALRVLAGRHFPTDTLAAAAAGALAAGTVAWLHRGPPPAGSPGAPPAPGPRGEYTDSI